MRNYTYLCATNQGYMIDTTVFQNKTAVYYTLGCKLNFSETSTIGKLLKEAGVRTARRGEKADICVVNTWQPQLIPSADTYSFGDKTERCAGAAARKRG